MIEKAGVWSPVFKDEPQSPFIDQKMQVRFSEAWHYDSQAATAID